jgi:type I restriction enzyme S subunit
VIANLKPYPTYKPSGFAWFDSIPMQWTARRTKNLFKERIQKGFPNEPHLAATQSMGVVRKDRFAERTVIVTKDFHLLKLVEKGDFVVSLRSFQGGIEICHDRGIISPAYTILTPISEGNRAYFRHFFKAKPFVRGLTLYVTGIRQGQNVDYTRLSRDYLPVPPPDEQELIVRFLDWASVRLGKAIAAKRKVIGLLEEQKQAIIHRAVTRGLDDSVPLKPSGLEWLGYVPEHWHVKRIKYLMRVVDNRSENGDEVLLSMRKYHGLVPYHEHFSKPPQAATLKGFKIIEKGQIATNRMQAGFGLIFESTQRGIVSPDFGVFQPTGEVIPEFLGLLFRSRIVRAKFHGESKGLGTGKSGFMRLYDDRIGWIHIAYPPTVDEQELILQKLAGELEDIAKPRGTVEREIELLQEYRTRLIADVVTGKLDVREFARTLPADIAEEAAELASSELGDEFSDTDDELADELTGEPA